VNAPNIWHVLATISDKPLLTLSAQLFADVHSRCLAVDDATAHNGTSAASAVTCMYTAYSRAWLYCWRVHSQQVQHCCYTDRWLYIHWCGVACTGTMRAGQIYGILSAARVCNRRYTPVCNLNMVSKLRPHRFADCAPASATTDTQTSALPPPPLAHTRTPGDAQVWRRRVSGADG
jgi:hypothetical protein